jgi:hypothetical protein
LEFGEGVYVEVLFEAGVEGVVFGERLGSREGGVRLS